MENNDSIEIQRSLILDAMVNAANDTLRHVEEVGFSGEAEDSGKDILKSIKTMFDLSWNDYLEDATREVAYVVSGPFTVNDTENRKELGDWIEEFSEVLNSEEELQDEVSRAWDELYTTPAGGSETLAEGIENLAMALWDQEDLVSNVTYDLWDLLKRHCSPPSLSVACLGPDPDLDLDTVVPRVVDLVDSMAEELRELRKGR